MAEEILSRSLVAYRVLVGIIRIATEVFFRRIEVSGRDTVPDDGAVIFAGNHPNSLLDPILITAYADRVVHFAAKDGLFRNPLLRMCLRIVGAIPVKRRMDHAGAKVDNSDMFETMYSVLAAGRSTGIFPEGISHDRSELAPLKSGAARMAFGVLERHPETPVYVVPTGLVYFERHRFRSNVFIQFGPPIAVDKDWLDRYQQDPKRAAADLTAHIDSRLRALTINAEHWNRIWVLDGVHRLYQPADVNLEERVRVARRFNLAYPKVKDEPEVRRLYRRVEAYLLRKSAAGVDDATLRGSIGAGRVALGLIGHLVLLAVYLPLFIIGAPVHVPLGLLLKLAGRVFAPRSDVVATTKFLLGLGLILVTYSVLTALVWWRLGALFGIVTMVLLPASGWAAVRVISRAYMLRHALLTGLRRATLRREIDALRQERAELVEEVVAMVGAHRKHADDAEAELAGEGA